MAGGGRGVDRILVDIGKALQLVRTAATDQDFALVCYNCVDGVIFTDAFESGDLTLWE